MIWQINQQVAEKQQETVKKIISQGRNAATALELGWSALVWADHLVAYFESLNHLPHPLACQPGCDFCCFNQVEVTPPEALLLGRQVEEYFSEEHKQAFLAGLGRIVEFKAGKSKKKLARVRRQLPCLFLTDGECSVYRVRPLVCRAMHAFDASRCKQALTSGDLRAVEHYAHRYEMMYSVVKGLLDGCRDLGCQAGYLDLTGALWDFFQQPDPVEKWVRGEQVFSRLRPPSFGMSQPRR